MAINKHFFSTNTVTSLCAAIVTAVLITGCMTDPVTGKSTLDPKFVAVGSALAGGVAGGFIGNAVGGGTGAAIGAAVGAGVGGLAGYYITDYLNTREQQEYIANLNQHMKATPVGASGSDSWVNSDRTKAINTSFGPEMPLQQILTKSGNQIPLNQQRLASLPPNPNCRPANSTFRVNGQPVTTPVISCRTAEGDYIQVNGTAA